MANFNVADFYYGAVLSKLFNNNILPALVEGDDDRQIYKLTTNDGEYRLFIKYRAKSRPGVHGQYRSWQFTFTSEDIDEIFGYISDGHNLLMALVCGEEGFNGSELAVLDRDDITQCLGGGKTSLTISRAKGEKAFRISMGGGRKNAIKIPSNRLVG
ncbi:hypothetical protein SCACP_36680 [Sporomusa carbonis]|uniref:hypothetical protein n=1 Tax=Sporomusa carbonis TaxID=3076075 RepID=UPI003A6ED854